MDTINRLQFRHHDEIFEDRCKAIEYIYDKIKENGAGLASEQNSPYSYSLFAEPTILRYANSDDDAHECETFGDEACNSKYKKGPHIMLVIGADTNDTIYHERNKFCIIDIDKTEEEIKDLEEELAKAVKSLTLAVLDTSTLDLHVEKTEEGTFLSGDVKTAKTHVFEDVVRDNNLMIVPFDDEAGPEGLFIYVDLKYDEASETFTFIVTNSDGTLKKTSVKLPNNYLVSGEYKKQDESLHLHMRNGDEVVIDCEELIAEWGVEGEASKTPIVLTREEVDYDNTAEHHHVEPWQDVLRADVRVANHIDSNILKKTNDGRYLYVDGRATNIAYYYNGELSNVSEQLDKLNQIKVSNDNDNIIWDRVDGFFATAKLDYITNKNKLIFTTSNVSGGTVTKEIQLNSVELFQNIYYNRATEELVITYKDTDGNLKVVKIPIGDMLDEWDVLNEGHNVRLTKTPHHVSGKDILTADAKIHEGDNNILEDKNHELYVNGVSANIKYDVTGDTTVKDVLDDLKAADEALDEKIDNEIARAESAETELQAAIEAEGQRAQDAETEIMNTIGSGFSTDTHETITYKFDQLTDKVNSEAEKLQSEIERSMSADTVHDSRLDTIETEIGDGFGPRFTIEDAVNELSADTRASLKHVVNEDESIDVVERDGSDGKEAVVKVNLSTEVEDDRKNIIKLNSDGLFANVDLSYIEEANKLIFHTSNGEPDKEIQLESISSIISIEYNPSKEAIVITYMTNGHEIKTVEIPVGDLINEWRVEDGHPHAVQLEKVRVPSGTSEQDILKASVIITDDHDDNILVMDDGALYVPANTDVTAALSGAIDSLDDKIDAETIRAISAETVLSGAISTVDTNLQNEINRATSEEERIESKLDNEITRSTAKDQELEASIAAETERATSAETSLSTALNDERIRAISAETALQTSIDNEVTRATTEETRLEHLIEDEKNLRITSDGILQNNIDSETQRATEAETRIETKIDNEITRATAEDQRLYQLIVDEQIRATNADEVLDGKINDEAIARVQGDAELKVLISGETAAREARDTIIETNLQSEIDRSTAEDERLSNAITAETEAREQGDAELEQMILDATLTFSPANDNFESNGTIEFNRYDNDNNVVKANVIIPTDDNIIIVDNGIKASVRLDYNAATNTLLLEKTSASGRTFDTVQLNAGSIIESITYDNETKELVIRYESTSEPGVEKETRVGVSDLFNPWIVKNPSEKSAVELSKTFRTGPLAEDELSGRVLITDDHDGDGKPDQGSDNIIEIRNNGLYVCGSGITEAQEIAECVQNEIKVFETAVIGHIIGQECGSGYTYEPHNMAKYINSATSFNNADYILDQSIKKVEENVEIISAKTDCNTDELKSLEKAVLGNVISEECGEGFVYSPNLQATYINSATSFNNADNILDQNLHRIEIYADEISAKTDCVDSKANVMYKLLYGENSVMPDCGEGVEYLPYQGCVISSARSFMEADEMLNDQICQILTMWVSGITCSNESTWVEDGMNRKLQVDLRLSHGNNAEMDDDNLYIHNLDGDYIDPTGTEFTDTNVLRMVCLTESPGGVIPDIKSKQNGIYLSNIWDCGLYYGPDDTEAKAAAEAAGYNTDYSTDEDSSASNYNYMNNVRQSDIPHD